MILWPDTTKVFMFAETDDRQVKHIMILCFGPHETDSRGQPYETPIYKTT